MEQPTPIPPLRARALVLWALLGSALLYLSFFPVSAGWLAWIALVPWLVLLRQPRRPRRLYLIAWLGGLAFFWPVLQWMRVADYRMYFTWGGLATYCAVYVPLAFLLIRRLDRGTSLPLTFTFPLVWVSLEFIRWGSPGGFYSLIVGTHQHDVPGGFSWYFLGHTQHDTLEVIQIADLAGVYGVSLLIGLVNGCLFEILYARSWFRERFFPADAAPPSSRLSLMGQGLIVLVLLTANLAYGRRQLAFTPSPDDGPVIALLQGNVDQRIRTAGTSPDEEERREAGAIMRSHYELLADLASWEKPVMMVWPETSFPGYWQEVAPGHPTRQCARKARDFTLQHRCAQLLGINSEVLEDDHSIHSYNSAVFIERSGQYQGRYDKVHRVPFGEFVPLKKAIPLLNKLAPYDYDYAVAPGKEFTQFRLADGKSKWSFGVVICYEDTDTSMTRPYVPQPRGSVDFLLNISNDGWFNGTAEHDQHLAICRFRAIETRRSVARAVNMGISAVIDPNGRVLAPEVSSRYKSATVWRIPDGAEELPMSRWHEFKKTEGVIIARIPIERQRQSAYALVGDVVSFVLLLVLGVLLILARPPRQEGS